MASPFAAFRKYQGILLAVFGVIIILVFAVGDPLMQMARTHNTEDPVVVEYKGGKVTQHQLDRMVYSRRVAANLLATLRYRGMYASLPPEYRNFMSPEDFHMRVPLDTRGLVLSQSDLTPEGAVRSMLLARKATELGMRVSPKEVRDYLSKNVAFETVRDPEIKLLIEGDKGDKTGHSVDMIWQTLSQELLAYQLYNFVGRGLRAIPPAEQFDYYMKLNRKVKAEVIAIPVDEFLSKVPEPTDADLTAYFDRYKDKLPHKDFVRLSALSSPTPGFKLPHRAKVQYLKANFDDLVSANRAKVTEADIVKYYEENKLTDSNLQELSLPPVEAKDKGKSKKNQAGETKATTQPSGTSPPAAQPSGAVPANVPADRAKEDAKTPPSATKTPTAPRAGTELAANDGEKADKPGTTPAAQPTGTPGKTQLAPQGTDAATATHPVLQGTGGGLATLPATQGSGGFPPTVKSEPPKPKPLSEVRDYIQKKLAEEMAEESIAKTFRAIGKRLQDNASLRLTEKNPPPLTNFEELAKQYNLTAHTTGLLSADQMAEETDIGKSVDSARQSYPSLIYSSKGPHSLHQVFVTSDTANGSRYISWKIEDKEEEAPSLADVRADVVKHWKRGAGLDEASGKARDLALAEAGKLAAQIRKGESMKVAAASVPGAKLISTDEFSWLTEGELPRMRSGAPAPPTLSKIDDIDDPGDAFMEKAFSLKPDEVGVALNHPGTYAYVMKVQGVDKTPGVLMSTFISELGTQARQQESSMATSLQIQELNERLFEQLDKDFKLKWLKTPAELGRREQD